MPGSALRQRIERLERQAATAGACGACGGRPRFLPTENVHQPEVAAPRCPCGNRRVAVVQTGLPGRSVDNDRPVLDGVPAEVVARVDLGVRLRGWQMEVARGRKRFTVVVAHRRAGKTLLALAVMLHEALQEWRPAAQYAYVAPYLRQAKATCWSTLKALSLRLPGTVVSEGDLSVRLANGATLRLYGGDLPDSLRGLYFDGLVLDEYAQMKSELRDEVLQPALTDRRGWQFVIGTPAGVDAFSSLYHRALAEGDVWYAGRFTVDHTGALPEAEVRLSQTSMDENAFRREFLCDFSASADDQLVPIDVARAAANRSAPPGPNVAPLVLGVDVARFGGDRTVVFPRRGRAALAPRVFRGLDLMQGVGVISSAILELRPAAVFIDATGMGAGVVDRLRELGHRVSGIEFGGAAHNPKFANRRAEMWCALANWLREGGCIPQDESLISDLCAPKYFFDSSGRQRLEPKEDIKRRGLPSPDLADALALTFAKPVTGAAKSVQQERYSPPWRR